TFTPSLDALTTTAAQLQTALLALPTIGPGNVSVTGSTGGPYTITFQNTLGITDLSLLDVVAADGADFSTAESVAGSPNAPGILVNEVQRLIDSGNVGGTFDLEFGGQSTAGTPFGGLDAQNATADQVESALNSLSTISADGGFVKVTLVST